MSGALETMLFTPFEMYIFFPFLMQTDTSPPLILLHCYYVQKFSISPYEEIGKERPCALGRSLSWDYANKQSFSGCHKHSIISVWPFSPLQFSSVSASLINPYYQGLRPQSFEFMLSWDLVFRDTVRMSLKKKKKIKTLTLPQSRDNGISLAESYICTLKDLGKAGFWGLFYKQHLEALVLARREMWQQPFASMLLRMHMPVYSTNRCSFSHPFLITYFWV